MRLDNWTRLSWWQRSRLAMIACVVIAVTVTILIVALIATLQNSPSLAALSWISFTAFPLAIVIAIATLARLQLRINIRSPQSRDAGRSD